MKVSVILACVISLFSVVDSISAQECPDQYDRVDRTVVLSHSERFALNRMTELAALVADEVFSLTQIVALNNEYQALKDYIAEGQPVPNISQRSNEFLATLLDAEYLELQHTTLLGKTIEEAQFNAREALARLSTASFRVRYCIGGSWERVTLDLSEFNGRCGGGYHRFDRQLVLSVVSQVDFLIARLIGLAHDSAVNVTSVNQRALGNFDFEYLREEIELIGEAEYRRARPSTRRFIQETLDAGYLGIAEETIRGQTIEMAQRNAREALEALEIGQRRLLTCLADR